jgi:hypothetical protein
MFLPRLDYILKDINRVDKAFEEHTSTHEQQHDSSHTSATTNRDLHSTGMESSAVESRNLEETRHHPQFQSRGRGSGRSVSTRRRNHQDSQNNSKRPILQIVRPLQGKVLQTMQMALPPQYAAAEQGSA